MSSTIGRSLLLRVSRLVIIKGKKGGQRVGKEMGKGASLKSSLRDPQIPHVYRDINLQCDANFP